VSGRPLVVNDEISSSSAFVAAWLPGSEGAGVAEVLFGEYDFSGRLSFSWPWRDDEHRNIGDSKAAPDYPVGFGLGYSI
jgi:beta-glucosidase